MGPTLELDTLVSSTVALSSPSLREPLASLPKLLRILKTTSSTTDSSPSSARTSSVTIPDSCPTSIFSWKVCSTLNSLSSPFSTTMTFTCLEIEDNEAGLTGEFSEADVRNLNKDRAGEHGAAFKSLRYPDRVANNYQRSDDALSCYKIHPKVVKALV